MTPTPRADLLKRRNALADVLGVPRLGHETGGSDFYGLVQQTADRLAAHTALVDQLREAVHNQGGTLPVDPTDTAGLLAEINRMFGLAQRILDNTVAQSRANTTNLGIMLTDARHRLADETAARMAASRRADDATVELDRVRRAVRVQLGQSRYDLVQLVLDAYDERAAAERARAIWKRRHTELSAAHSALSARLDAIAQGLTGTPVEPQDPNLTDPEFRKMLTLDPRHGRQ